MNGIKFKKKVRLKRKKKGLQTAGNVMYVHRVLCHDNSLKFSVRREPVTVLPSVAIDRSDYLVQRSGITLTFGYECREGRARFTFESINT